MRIWIYGAPFSGKTTFASQFKGAKILSTDGNAEYIFPKENIYRIKSYEDLDNAFKELKNKPPETLVVDTTEYLLDYIKFHWYKTHNIGHESEIAFKGYVMLRNELWSQIFSLANLCENTIFISHELMYTEKNKFGREITRFAPQFEPKLKDKMDGLMTIVMRSVVVQDESKGSQYKLHIKHTDDEEGGTRLPIKETEINANLEEFQNNFIKKENK